MEDEYFIPRALFKINIFKFKCWDYFGHTTLTMIVLVLFEFCAILKTIINQITPIYLESYKDLSSSTVMLFIFTTYYSVIYSILIILTKVTNSYQISCP